MSVTGRGGRAKRPGLRVHRPRTLRPDEVTTRDRIPVTTPARTILDLAGLKHIRLDRVLDQAEILERTDYPALDAVARAHPGHRGAGRLLRLLASYEAGATLTRSDLERIFIALCAKHGLPAPLVNHHLGDHEVDFLFVEQRVIVEADSWKYHRTRQAFQRDRRRDSMHLQAGYRTLRFTDRELATEPGAVAAAVAAVVWI